MSQAVAASPTQTDRTAELLAGIEASEAKLEAKLESKLSELAPRADTRQLINEMFSEVRNTVYINFQCR